MKTLRLLMAVGLLLGSYAVGIAQSKSVPAVKAEKKERFASEAEEAAWIQANPAKYEAEKAQTKASAKTTGTTVKTAVTTQSRVRTNKAVAPAKQIPANAVKATTTVSESKSTERVKIERVNNTTKALPANYKPTSTETEKSDK
ncbi:MAG: hypothetical protein JKX84_08860 [Flavobacteriales bacterium]|nr:hypothetical protein [Flavobacteriales bacterium]